MSEVQSSASADRDDQDRFGGGTRSINGVKRVLVAVDGSEQSRYAFAWTLQNIIDPERHVLYLICVARTDPRESTVYSAGGAGGMPWSVSEEPGNERLDEAKKCVLDCHQIARTRFCSSQHPFECHSLVGQGDARDEIVDAAEKADADLLILGSRGTSAFKRAFLGSTGDYCAHHATCPVLIVKPPAEQRR